MLLYYNILCSPPYYCPPPYSTRNLQTQVCFPITIGVTMIITITSTKTIIIITITIIIIWQRVHTIITSMYYYYWHGHGNSTPQHQYWVKTSQSCSFKRTSARKSLWETLRSSERCYVALARINASTKLRSLAIRIYENWRSPCPQLRPYPAPVYV